MDTYKITELDNGDILLSKILIGLGGYTIKIFDNGDKLLKKIKSVDIKEIEELKNYNFINSSVIKCNIKKEKYDKLKYKQILDKIYGLINDGTKIIKNTKLNIKTTKKEVHGFYYMDELGISIQGVNNNKCILEIMNQCIENKFPLNMEIKLMDDMLVSVSVEHTEKLIKNSENKHQQINIDKLEEIKEKPQKNYQKEKRC